MCWDSWVCFGGCSSAVSPSLKHWGTLVFSAVSSRSYTNGVSLVPFDSRDPAGSKRDADFRGRRRRRRSCSCPRRLAGELSRYLQSSWVCKSKCHVTAVNNSAFMGWNSSLGADYIMTLLAINTLNQRAFPASLHWFHLWTRISLLHLDPQTFTLWSRSHIDVLQLLTKEASWWTYGMGHIC